MIKKSTILLLLFFVFTNLFAATMRVFQDGYVRIIYASSDSIYIESSNKLLTSVLTELTIDFHIQKKDSINIFIVPSRKDFYELSQNELPHWTAAFASPSTKSLYVKSPRWDRPETDFYSTLAHELVHLIIHAHMGNRQLPRWMDEGLAVFYSNEKQWQQATAISRALLTNSIIPLNDIESVLEFHQPKAELAYQQSYSAVRYILEFYDIDGMRRIIDTLRRGKSLDDAVFQGTGSSFTAFEQEWKTYIYQKHRWGWLQDLDSFFWIFILLLLPFVYLAIKKRQKKVTENWDGINLP